MAQPQCPGTLPQRQLVAGFCWSARIRHDLPKRRWLRESRQIEDESLQRRASRLVCLPWVAEFLGLLVGLEVTPSDGRRVSLRATSEHRAQGGGEQQREGVPGQTRVDRFVRTGPSVITLVATRYPKTEAAKGNENEQDAKPGRQRKTACGEVPREEQ